MTTTPTRKCQHQQCTEPGTAEVYVYDHFLLYCKPHAYDLTYALLRANVPYQTRSYLASAIQPDLDYWRKGTV